MYENRKEFFDHLKRAPNPKELKRQFIEELRENKATILEFRQELREIMEARSPAPKLEGAEVTKTLTKRADHVANHLEALTNKFNEITEGIAERSRQISEAAEILRRWE